jgi:sugar lactone lactonase YvrE
MVAEQMRLIPVARFAIAALLVGCSAPGGAAGISGSDVGFNSRPENVHATSSSAKLLVANCYDATVYQIPGGNYQKRIGFAKTDRRSLLVTTNGYAVVGIPAGSYVKVYGGPKFKFLQKITVKSPFAMAQDPSGNLFVLSQGRSVYEYAPGSSLPYNPTPVRAITSSLKDAQNIAVDTEGNLYVANTGVRFKGTNVPVFAPGSTTPTRTITQGISGPYSIALDQSDNLYVGNFLALPDGDVTVYKAGTSTPTTTITSGISQPSNLAFDGSGNLYVANENQAQRPYTVTEYSAKHYALTRTISNGVDLPDGLAFDREDNLYVANFYDNSVTGYPSGTTQPMQTITQNVCYPSAVGIQE